jgi:hypothetical protein
MRYLIALILCVSTMFADQKHVTLAGAGSHDGTTAGSFIFFLTGERFEGTGILLLGHGLQVVTRISVDTQSTAITPSISATEGAGLPSAIGRRTGDMHYDTTAQFWYRITEGVWQQQP